MNDFTKTENYYEAWLEEHTLRVAALKENHRLRRIIALYEKYLALLDEADELEHEDDR